MSGYERRRAPRWVLAVAVAVCSLATGVSSPARASDQTAAGTNGRILYRLNAPDGLRTIDPQAANPGTTVKNVASFPGEEGASFSPDGNRIATFNGGRIQVMNADGSNKVTLVTYGVGSWVQSIRWSPNGQKLVYNYGTVGTDPGDTYALSSTTAPTTPRRLTTNAQPGSPGLLSWAPDSATIAYTARFGATDSELYIQQVDYGAPQQVTNDTVDQHQPVWTPNGDRIAYTTYSATGPGIAVTGTVNMFGFWVIGGTGWVAPPSSRTPGGYKSWSPDSSRLLVPFHDGVSVYTTPPLGMGTWPEIKTLIQTKAYVVWSPDGTKIAYNPKGATTWLWVMNADGTNPHLVLNSEAMPLSWQRR